MQKYFQKKWLVYLPSVVFGVFILLYFRQVTRFQIIHKADSWLAGEWLINYTAGFVRRGLVGQLLIWSAGFAPGHLLDILIAFKMLWYGLFCGALVALVIRQRLRWAELLLMIAPWGLMFELMDERASGRKEILLFAVLLLFLASDVFATAASRATVRRWQFWGLTIAAPLLVLTHEGLLFFYPLFYFADWRRAPEEFLKNIGQKLVPLGLALLTFGAVYLNQQVPARSTAIICRSLTKLKIDGSVCDAAIDALKLPPPHIELARYSTFFAIPFLLTFVALALYGWASVPSRSFKKSLVALALIFASSFPLYFIAVDWGRWIHIYGFSVFLVLFTYRDGARLDEKLSHWGRGIPIALLLLAYDLSWKLKPFIGDDSSLSRILNSVPNWLRALLP